MKEMFLFNDPLNTFYYGYIASVKEHRDSRRGKLLLPIQSLRLGQVRSGQSV